MENNSLGGLAACRASLPAEGRRRLAAVAVYSYRSGSRLIHLANLGWRLAAYVSVCTDQGTFFAECSGHRAVVAVIACDCGEGSDEAA